MVRSYSARALSHCTAGGQRSRQQVTRRDFHVDVHTAQRGGQRLGRERRGFCARGGAWLRLIEQELAERELRFVALVDSGFASGSASASRPVAMRADSRESPRSRRRDRAARAGAHRRSSTNSRASRCMPMAASMPARASRSMIPAYRNVAIRPGGSPPRRLEAQGFLEVDPRPASCRHAPSQARAQGVQQTHLVLRQSEPGVQLAARAAPARWPYLRSPHRCPRGRHSSGT